MAFSNVRPRHVLCCLGQPGVFADLHKAIQSAIDSFAGDFRIDNQYSQDAPDDGMEESFDICWDLIDDDALSLNDTNAVVTHGCVIYVLGPPMTQETAIETSAIAIRLVKYGLENGATAIKGESAGVAHSVTRWRQIAHDAALATDRVDLARACRLAFCRRPLDYGEFFASVGFHLVGLPEVFVSKRFSDDELALTTMIDQLADDMSRNGVASSVAKNGAILLPDQDYEEDDFKYNPYGVVYLADEETAPRLN